MRIVVLAPRGVSFSSDSPWNSLIHGLRLAGNEVSGFGIGEGSYDAIVSMNHQPVVGEVQSRHAIAPSRTVLVALEPRVTLPRMYTRQALVRYGHRYAASPLWAERLTARSFLWPQEIGPQRITRRSEQFAASMINGNKRSAIPGSLYGLRRATIRECERQGLPLAVFGPGWDAPYRAGILSGARACAKALVSGIVPRLDEPFSNLSHHPKSWLGIVADKLDALSSAPVSIVIENSADYVSEKLVDAIRGGAAPVYVGPSLERFGIPASLAVAAPPTPDGIVGAVRELSQPRIDEIVSAGGDWLASQCARAHEIRSVLDELGQSIGTQLQA